jgi:uncharacterized membrane protein YfcA
VTSEFLLYAGIGFVAQLVDGTIGMAYGVISTTALLSAGLSPLAASANVHFAEVVTGSINGAFHVRRGHVAWALVRRLAITGSIGALGGAWLLVALTPGRVALVRRAIAVYLLILGISLCWRGLRQQHTSVRRSLQPRILGFVGGLFDSAGGGWGPIVTSNLMIGGLAPRVAIGSSIVAECIVTAVHAATFAGVGGLRPELPMAGLLLGGVIAAPLAPRLAARLPTRRIITSVGFTVVVVSVWLIVR